jgi:oxalate---CoA ligase
VLAKLESTFGVPVVEAYGMTEAAHQMASNPLPPGVRKPGTVGLAAGPEIVVLDAAGAVLAVETVGEIAIRGANVTLGYEANPDANAAAFTNGWFRTGDLGIFDADGYLTIVGRVKEMINRAGEKISPREIDEALLAHPAVAQAVAFSMPDPRLGEDVAAAVVLREGASAGERELREHVGARLASFKVPRRIAIVEAIPEGPTGKLQRIGLAERLGLVGARTHAAEYVEPRTALELTLAGIWRDVLELERVGVRDDFLDVGGDSVLAAQIMARIRRAVGKEISPIVFFEASTVETQARYLESKPDVTSGVEDLLDKLDGLSDEDVKRLLSEG